MKWEDTEEFNKEDFLSNKEVLIYEKFKTSKRRKEFLMGRYIAKTCLTTGGEDIKKISIIPGVFKQPVIDNNCYKHLQVSLSHSNKMAVAVSFPEVHPVSVDIEAVKMNILLNNNYFLNSKERHMLANLNILNDFGYTLIWSAKEALSKNLRTGLYLTEDVLEISDIEKKEERYIIYYSKIKQYKCCSFIRKDLVLSICMPKNSFLTESTVLEVEKTFN